MESLHLSKCFSIDGQRLLADLCVMGPGRAGEGGPAVGGLLRCFSFSDLPRMHLATLPLSLPAPPENPTTPPLPPPAPRLSLLGQLEVLGFTNCVRVGGGGGGVGDQATLP